VYDYESQRERGDEQQSCQRLGHQDRSGNNSAASRNKLSKLATTRPIAFSALTGADQPEL